MKYNTKKFSILLVVILILSFVIPSNATTNTNKKLDCYNGTHIPTYTSLENIQCLATGYYGSGKSTSGYDKYGDIFYYTTSSKQILDYIDTLKSDYYMSSISYSNYNIALEYRNKAERICISYLQDSIVGIEIKHVTPPPGYVGYLSNFKTIREYENNFVDIKEEDWWTPSVNYAYECGLAEGVSSVSFDPTGNISVAQAITFAARIHSIYYGIDIPEVEGEWFQKYVDYAANWGIIEKGEFDEMLYMKATRARLAYILSHSISEDDLEKINYFISLPDVDKNTTYQEEIFNLYWAGICTGKDIYGTFGPLEYVTRAETVTLISRIINKDNRLEFSPQSTK